MFIPEGVTLRKTLRCLMQPRNRIARQDARKFAKCNSAFSASPCLAKHLTASARPYIAIFWVGCGSNFNQTATVIICNIVWQTGANRWPIKQEDLFLITCWLFIRFWAQRTSVLGWIVHFFIGYHFHFAPWWSFVLTWPLRRKIISVSIDQIFQILTFA